MKILSPRQQAILKLITQKGDLRVEEIQQEAGISKATAYREVQTLISLGYAAKIPGGLRRIETPSTHCVQCGRESGPRTAFLIKKKDGLQLNACCPHCGLMALTNRTDIHAVMTTDFFYGTLINAAQAWYVIDSSVSLCCQPSVLSFANKKNAERFVLGFGGVAVDFSGAQDTIRILITL
jgi:DeoR family transcriptional regulator, copper-sensing transcriptional repressor